MIEKAQCNKQCGLERSSSPALHLDPQAHLAHDTAESRTADADPSHAMACYLGAHTYNNAFGLATKNCLTDLPWAPVLHGRLGVAPAADFSVRWGW